jgi:hypothetical protein
VFSCCFRPEGPSVNPQVSRFSKQTLIGACRGGVGLTNQISPAHRVRFVVRASRSAQPRRSRRICCRFTRDHTLVSGTFASAPVLDNFVCVINNPLLNALMLRFVLAHDHFSKTKTDNNNNGWSFFDQRTQGQSYKMTKNTEIKQNQKTPPTGSQYRTCSVKEMRLSLAKPGSFTSWVWFINKQSKNQCHHL